MQTCQASKAHWICYCLRCKTVLPSLHLGVCKTTTEVQDWLSQVMLLGNILSLLHRIWSCIVARVSQLIAIPQGSSQGGADKHSAKSKPIHIQVHVPAHTHIHTSTHTRIYTRVHTHKHTYTHV